LDENLTSGGAPPPLPPDDAVELEPPVPKKSIGWLLWLLNLLKRVLEFVLKLLLKIGIRYIAIPVALLQLSNHLGSTPLLASFGILYIVGRVVGSSLTATVVVLLVVWVSLYPFATVAIHIILRTLRLMCTTPLCIARFFISFLFWCAACVFQVCKRVAPAATCWIQNLPALGKDFFAQCGRRGRRYIVQDLLFVASASLLILVAGWQVSLAVLSFLAALPTPSELYEFAVVVYVISWILGEIACELCAAIAPEFVCSLANAMFWWISWLLPIFDIIGYLGICVRVPQSVLSTFDVLTTFLSVHIWTSGCRCAPCSSRALSFFAVPVPC
jgi:hypothetical protein